MLGELDRYGRVAFLQKLLDRIARRAA